MFTSFAERSNEAELMDGSDYTPDELIENLDDLRRVNRLLGGTGALTEHLFPMIEETVRSGERQRPGAAAEDALRERQVAHVSHTAPSARVRLLDVGTGSADIPAKIVRWARARGIGIEFTVLDLNEIAAREARAQTANYPEIKVVRADAMNLPFADRSFDFVLASLFLHHFENDGAAALIRSFARVSRVAFVVNDLRRHPVAYYSIKLLTQIFTRNRLVRNDAALSVLRGFVEGDVEEIARQAQIEIRIFRRFPYRLILIG
ncbi:MAG: methyltransferase domain-containing protein [Blastocatellia bacterium]